MERKVKVIQYELIALGSIMVCLSWVMWELAGAMERNTVATLETRESIRRIRATLEQRSTNDVFQKLEEVQSQIEDQMR